MSSLFKEDNIICPARHTRPAFLTSKHKPEVTPMGEFRKHTQNIGKLNPYNLTGFRVVK